MEDLDAESAISAGGWDARYAVPLAVASHGVIAAALIDTNGDGADIDLDEYERGPDGGWHESVSGNVDERGTHWSCRIASAWGQADTGAQVEIDYLGQSHSVNTSRTGWWLFVGPATDDPDTVPRTIDHAV